MYEDGGLFGILHQRILKVLCLKIKLLQHYNLRLPGIEPGLVAWEATVMTIRPQSHI